MAAGQVQARRRRRRGQRARACWKTAPSTPQPGKLLFSDLTVDPTTGQVTLRAEVPNPNGALLPGLYVRVRLEQAAGQQRHRCCRSRP